METTNQNGWAEGRDDEPRKRRQRMAEEAYQRALDIQATAGVIMAASTVDLPSALSQLRDAYMSLTSFEHHTRELRTRFAREARLSMVRVLRADLDRMWTQMLELV
jgi:hypothetical protein